MPYFLKLLIPAIAIFLLVLVGYFSHMFLGNDNIVEEEVEKVLEDDFNVEIEFSKASKDKTIMTN